MHNIIKYKKNIIESGDVEKTKMLLSSIFFNFMI